MYTQKAIIESIADGTPMSDILAYVADWIGEVRTLADTIDEQYFFRGPTEDTEEGWRDHIGRAEECFHTLEMTLDWIQNAVEAASSYILCKEEAQEQDREAAEGQEKAK